MATPASRTLSYICMALVTGAAGLAAAAAFWPAALGPATATEASTPDKAPWLLLLGSLGLLTGALLVRAGCRGLPARLLRQARRVGERREPASFTGPAESAGAERPGLDGDGGSVLQLLDSLSTGVALLNRQTHILRANSTFCLLFNLRAEAVQGKPLREVLPAPFLARWSPHFLLTGDCRGEEIAEVPDPASGRVLRTTLIKIRSLKCVPELRALLVEEISGKLAAPPGGSEDGQTSRRILDGIREAVVLAGPDAAIVDLNRPAAEMLGYSHREALGLPLRELFAPNPDSPTGEKQEADLFTGEWRLDGRVVELPLVRQDKSVFPAELRFGEWGEDSRRRLLVSIRDTTAERQAKLLAEDRLRVIEMMSQDRPAEEVLAELAQMVEHQTPGARCVVLLQRAGRLRTAPSPGMPPDLLEHLDGLPAETWRSNHAAQKASAGSVLVFDIERHRLPSGLCGAASGRGFRAFWASPVYSADGLTLGFVVVCRSEAGKPTASEQSLLEAASRLAAVCLGRREQISRPVARDGSGSRSRMPHGGAAADWHSADLQAGLKRALDRGEFSLHFQPQFHVATEEMAAVEALLRWNHPQHGLILPSRFIPAAEECGMIVPIGEWVLREACRHARLLPQNGKGRQRIAVNVSGLHFDRAEFLEHVRLAVQESGIPPGLLELELPENLLLKHAEDWAARMAGLRELGVRITAEGFGSDCSSLGRLPRLPLNNLKIDRCFVRGLAGPGEGPALVKSISTLAESLRMEATAPCVETREQLEILESTGCSRVQGFLFGIPMTGDELRKQASTLTLRGQARDRLTAVA